MRILFLVRSLDLGGAERQLVAVTRGVKALGHEVAVAVFYGGGPFETEMREAGIPVHDLRKRGRWETARFLGRLAALLRRERPDVLHSYMHANVLAAAMKPLFPSMKVVWGIRSAHAHLFRQGVYGRVDQVYPLLERSLSLLADGIIANSEAARRHAISFVGLPARKLRVVPNGTDCEVFRPDPEGRAAVRARWGVPDDVLLVGKVARLDPVKDHPTFIAAAARVAAARDDVRFVCVNDGTRPAYRAELARRALDLGLGDRLLWADEGKVSRAVYSALDVAVLASKTGESFPNVIGEAMACGKRVVTTDSGDAPLIVGDTGAVAPTEDPEALARCIGAVLDERRRDGGPFAEAPRARIQTAYSLDQLARRTIAALEELGAPAAPGAVSAAAR